MCGQNKILSVNIIQFPVQKYKNTHNPQEQKLNCENIKMFAAYEPRLMATVVRNKLIAHKLSQQSQNNCNKRITTDNVEFN